MAIGLARVFLLDAPRVGQHQSRELHRACGAEYATVVAVRDQARQIADVIEVRVSEDNGIERRGRDRKRLPVARAQFLQALEQTAVEQHAPAIVLDQILGPGDRARGTEEGQLSHSTTISARQVNSQLPIPTPNRVTIIAVSLADAMRGDVSIVAAELRPPRAELDSVDGMDAWIDTYHSVRSLTRRRTRVFLTDSAVGTQEENNLRHLVANMGRDVSRDYVIPFLTSKHSLDFCLSYAEQAAQHGFSSLVVLGGDKTVGRPRCVEHAWQLRAEIRRRVPALTLGGWANPYADPARQVDFLVDQNFTGEYYLTQVVSHLDMTPVTRFLDETRRRGVAIPGMFGVFYYRSANARTLQILKQFMPVPVDALLAEFASGATPIDVCARSIHAMLDAGVRHFYVSNLPLMGAATTLSAIMGRVEALRNLGAAGTSAPARS
jgi:hypothetical protein